MDKKFLSIFCAGFIMVAPYLITGCNRSNRDSGKILQAENIGNDGGSGNNENSPDDGSADNPPSNSGVNNEEKPVSGGGGLHPIFNSRLGVPIPKTAIGIIDPDPTGHNASTDYDGDGIPNEEEIVSNEFVADYPRIVTRISPPITMEIRVDSTSIKENHSETVEDTDVKNTITNSMEDKHYTSMNRKTTPYVTKESRSNSEGESDSYGYANTKSSGGGISIAFPGGAGAGGSSNSSTSNSENWSTSKSFSSSTMSEKTVFEDVDYRDNLDRSGVEFKNDTVETISQNYRKSEILKQSERIGPNAGIVRAALFLKNLSINIPVKISNVICTLSFRTPAGEFLPVKTFKLRNEDYSEFNQEIYGDEELGPYTIEVKDLNTYEVKKALANGYVPQIHVVSYDMRKVADSNYNPGVENLKIVEENAKGRTALIKIVGSNMREIYRVAAFDINENGDISPGISLKKALFNIFRNRTVKGEEWRDEELTVRDANLKWKSGNNTHIFSEGISGNSWDMFETYIKTSTDENNRISKIETIKRIGNLTKYNPFNPEDNPSYNPNEPLSIDEVYKMKYFIILHNGRYFNGDINDPIWAGERYEIICYDVGDFNRHFDNYYYTPIQSGESFILDTRWNRLNNRKEFSRARYLGKVVKGDVVHIVADLLESRELFNNEIYVTATETPVSVGGNYQWNGDVFNYTFHNPEDYEEGIPGDFRHNAFGGVNSIIVRIDESQFAGSYEIKFGKMDAPLSTYRSVIVSGRELSDNNGKIIITRNTNDKNGNPAGKIEGGITYSVYVKARGRVYGVDVTRDSKSNGLEEARAHVEEVRSNTMPGNFSYSATGIVNAFDLRIGEASNTEYYIVEYQGPYNYGTGNSDPPVYQKFVHSGLNRINIGNPSEKITDPGVYRINVYAVNGNCLDKGLASQSGEKYLLINYEKYRDQKIFAPALKTSLSGLNSLDLEVNFNDGTGWYRLKLSNSDNAENFIDCRYTSFIEYDKQRFHIFFVLPDGTASQINQVSPGNYNVFGGGREEADIYIRTVAGNQFRDTFWLKKESGQSIITGNNVADFTGYWVNKELSDASKIEEVLSGNYTDDFILSSGDIGDYFFSPLRQRIFGIRALLTDYAVRADTSRIGIPSFTASRGSKKIIVSEIEAEFADSYIVYWKLVHGYSQEQINELADDTNLNGWDSSVEINSDTYTIEGLIHNREYVVAVKAFNEFGIGSEPVFLKDGADLKTLMPWTDEKPDKPNGISLSLGLDGKSIIVNNIFVPGEFLYELQWRNVTGKWNSPIQLRSDFNPISGKIESLQYWTRYAVRVRAKTESGIYGDFSDELTIETVKAPSRIPEPLVEWYNVSGLGRPNLYAGIHMKDIKVPEGTQSLEVEYNLHYEEGNISKTVPVTIDANGNANLEILPVSRIAHEITYLCMDLSTCYDAEYYYSNVSLDYTLKFTNASGEIINSTFYNDLGSWVYYRNGTDKWKLVE